MEDIKPVATENYESEPWERSLLKGFFWMIGLSLYRYKKKKNVLRLKTLYKLKTCNKEFDGRNQVRTYEVMKIWIIETVPS